MNTVAVAATPFVAPGRTLKRQLRATLVAGGVVLLIIVSGAVYSVVQVMTLHDRVTSTYYDALAFNDTLHTWLEDAVRAVQTYQATGYPPALEVVLEMPELDTAGFRASLAHDLGHDSDPVSTFDRLVEEITDWQATVGTQLGGDVASRLESLPPEQVDLGAPLLIQAEQTARGLAEELTQARTAANVQLVRWNLNLFMNVVVLTFAALAVGLGLWFILRRRIVEPLSDLACQAEAVSTGALTHQVSTDAPGEIAALARAVDAMRVELVDQMAAAQDAAEEIAAAHQHLTVQAEELRRSNRDLEQFAYVASHDLQEPLRKVASFTQLLRKRYGGQLDERADQYIDFAVDGAQRMQQLIEDLLGFSRVGRALDPARPVDLGEACRTAVSTFDATAAHGAVVEIGALPTIVGQQSLLVQLFQNLVGNALKFHDPVRAPRISIGATRHVGGWEDRKSTRLNSSHWE